MLDWKLFRKIIFGEGPPLPSVIRDPFEELHPEGLTMGTLIIGRQGSGKTSSLAGLIVERAIQDSGWTAFVLDFSGSDSDGVLTQTLRLPQDLREQLKKRIVFDDLGNPDWVIPLPEFSLEYGTAYEEQVQRVSTNLIKLAPELVRDAPFLAGLGLREIAPQVFRLLTAIENDHGETWQITEAKKLLVDKSLMTNALKKIDNRVPEARWFLQKVYQPLSKHERELRSFALLALLGSIEPREIRARMGYYKPGWTPKEAIEKGQIVLIDGSRLINQKNAQHYLFTQAYSLILQEINKRQPGNPKDKPVALIMDEVYSLLSIPGMAEEVGMLSPLYRSRKLELFIVLQALSQLAPELKKQIWTIGNIVCFAVSNFDEAYDLAQQMFSYEPQKIKMEAKASHLQPVTEQDRGQYLGIANKIQRMRHRECIVRRYISEKVLDQKVRYIAKTKEFPSDIPDGLLQEFKEQLLKERGVPIKDALEVIKQRTLKTETRKPQGV